MTNIHSTEGLELAQIIFYAMAVLPAFVCFAAHGKHGVMGWLYVIVMCGLRLAGNGMAYHYLSTTGHANEAAQIISGIGLSPLLLAALGILHEANHSIQTTLPSILKGPSLLLPHVAILTGIALAAASGGKSSLLEAGMIVLTIGWLIIAAFVVMSFRASSSNLRVKDEKKLLWAIMIAMPLIGVRVIYSVAIAFVDGRADGGGLPVQVIFGTIPEFIVMIAYIFAGIMTRKLASDREKMNSEPSGRGQNTLV
ncbi:hypothetical protein N7451_005922 [Penicillium sp. IBT 35674x]|nr:hypothetical protein N7451_005922 [Penicillium sp. IBT 35674x]